MNQEAIDSLRAERDSVLALLDMAMDERDRFLKQRDALAAENKALRDALQRIYNWNLHTAQYSIDFGSNGVRDLYRDIARAALTKEATNG